MIWEDRYGFLETIKDKNKYGIFLDMGVGKTALTLGLIDYKLFNGCQKILIITPKKVSENTWQNEMKKWDNFNYMLAMTTLIDGTPQKKDKLLTQASDYCLHIISSSLIPWLYGKRKKVGKKYVWEERLNRPKYDMIIIDECSQFKDTTTDRFKTLKKMLPENIFLLSGTAYSGITKQTKKDKEYYINADEMYYAFYLLGIYYGSLYDFREEFCYTDRYDKYHYRMSTHTYDVLNEALNKYVIKKTLELDVKMNIHKIYCQSDTVVLKRMIKQFYFENEDVEFSVKTKGIMINKALQIGNGFIYDKNKKITRINNYKLEATKEIINKTNDNVIIFYNFVEDKNALLQEFPQARLLDNQKVESEWNEGKIPILILSPFSCKYGLNLQKGGHTIIWFGLVWSGESYVQANKRVYRTGQKNDVDVYYLLANESYDEYVYKVLVNKSITMKEFTENILKNVDL